MSQTQSTLPRVATPPPLPGRPGPDRVSGVLKLVVALAATAAGVYLIFYNLGRGAAVNVTQGVFLGVILGFGLRLLLTGGAQVAGRRVGWMASLAVFAVVVVATGWGLPRAARAQMVKVEQRAWDELQASPKKFADYEAYKLWTATPRRGFAPAMAVAQVQEELARMEGQKSGRVKKLRGLIREYQYDMGKSGETEMQAAINLARQGLAKVYAQALADLAVRVEAGAAKQEFPEDPQMRAAFAAVIARLAKSDDDRVYLVFSSENAVPGMGKEEAQRDLEQTLAGGLPMVGPGEAFSPGREDRRRQAFKRAMEESLEKAFGDEKLVRLEPLEAGAERKGKVVFQVHCATRRAPGEFVLIEGSKETGRLFKIEVMWEFSVLDVDGKPLARNRSRSFPAQDVRFRRDDDDPKWAAYSVMMDSAYYNYCREMTGRLGLIPVKVKDYFIFEK